MKYLHRDLSEKVCSIDGELFESEWNEQCEKFLNEFNKLSNRLPKEFLVEFRKKHFHDNTINSILIERVPLKTKKHYTLKMELQDYYDKNVVHCLTFTDVKDVKSDLSFGVFAGSCDWKYCEILAVDKKRLSLEVLLFSESTLYFEFSKLCYEKIKTNK